MELNRWIEEVKQKSTVLLEMGKLRIRKVNLEKRISKLHCRIGERIDYLNKIGKSFEDDEIVKGLLTEIRNIEKEIEEIDTKMEALKKEKEREEKEEKEGGCSGD